jgi:hypothetical protein
LAIDSWPGRNVVDKEMKQVRKQGGRRSGEEKMQKQDPMKLISVDRVDKGGLGNESEERECRGE